MSKYTSRAFVYYGPGDVRSEELKIGCRPTDIIVKILASARCGTDRTVFYKGHPKVDPQEFFTTETDGLKPVLYPWD